MRSAPRRKRQRRLGAAVVEFALTLPLLIVLVVGLIEFARLSTLRHAADNAAYEAARHVIVPGATVGEATRQAEDLLARAGVRHGAISVNPAVIDEATSHVTVQVAVPLAGNSWLPPYLTKQRSVVRQTTLRTERSAVARGPAPKAPLPTAPTPAPPPPASGGSAGGAKRSSAGQTGPTAPAGDTTRSGARSSGPTPSPRTGGSGSSAPSSGGTGGGKATSGGGTTPASGGGKSSGGGATSGGGPSGGSGGVLGQNLR